MAEDVKSFITAKDLYVAPVAVVGCGAMGGVVALTLALDNPSLVGAVVLIDFALDGDYGSDDTTTTSNDDTSDFNGTNKNKNKGSTSITTAMHNNNNSSSTFSLPWWSMRVGQGAKFHSGEQLLAFLCHPLTNMSPDMMLQFYTMTTKQQDGVSKTGTETTNILREMMQAHYRQPGGAVKSALAMANNLATSSSSYYYDSDDDCDEGELSGEGKVSLKMDPDFCFSFDPGHLSTKMKKESSSSSSQQQHQHLLIICGAPTTTTAPSSGSWIHVDDAHIMASHSQSRFNAHVQTIPGGNHWLVADHPVELLGQLVKFLEGPAVNAFQVTCNNSSSSSNNNNNISKVVGRRPEALGLRALPEYDSLEQAQKALGPRKIPDKAAVQEELNKLRMEEGYVSSEDDEDHSNSRKSRTALSNNPSDYFGFVG
jgi:pimeloyl-ACP methyl ester carboxylesterase